jgi:hypothetical protein
MNGPTKRPSQVRAIFALAKERGLDHDALRDLAGGSIRELSYTEAQRVIQRLKGHSFVPLRTLQYRRKKAGVRQMVQASQLKLIAELASQRWSSPEPLKKLCLNVCKREKPLTTDEANKVIEALKAMNAREGLWAA